MPTFRYHFRIFAALLCLSIGPVLAVQEEWTGGPSLGEPDTWKEQPAQLPPYPDGKHYIEVPVDRVSANLRMFVDEPALNVGADGVVRYTLMLRSSSGTENVFYEGIRCSTQEWRSYAYGSSAGKWQALDETPWQFLRNLGVQSYRLELYRYYLCNPKVGPRSRDDMLRRMRYGVPAGEVMGIDG